MQLNLPSTLQTLRLLTGIHAPVAQLVEQLPLKEMVVGSIPTGRTKITRKMLRILRVYFFSSR